MRNFQNIVALAGLTLAATTAMAATVTEFAVTPDAKARPDIWPLVTSVVLGGQKGDSVTVFDPKTSRRVATITVTEEISQSPNQNAKSVWLMKQQADQVGKLKQFFADKSQGAATVDLVQYIKGLPLRKQEYPGHTVQAVFIGSPMVTSPEAYSMVNRYPSDAFLSTPDTLYSTNGKQAALQGITLHVIHSADLSEFSPKNKDFHHGKIRRFYGLFVSGMGGNLATFSGSLEHLKSVGSQVFAPVSYGQPDRGDGKLRVFEVTEPRLEREDQGRQTSLWDAPVSRTPLAGSTTKALVDVGLSWNRDVDLDVFVRAEGDKELYYREPSSDRYGGRFLKDIRGLPASRGFETVTYAREVPLRSLQVYVNHYSGQSNETIEGELRIRVGDAVFSKKFVLPAGSGTGGAGARNHNTAWIRFDVPAILGGQ